MDQLKPLIDRLAKIGIEIKVSGNIPWIYLVSVNGNKIQPEDFANANHGYTIAWISVHKDRPGVKLDEDLKETFRIIRKYK
jgi:hypothetical protein